MPLKVKKLKAALAKAGFVQRPAKGSHTMWVHPELPGNPVTISGKDGDDAEKYQIRDVRNALGKLGKTL
jgi:predicted RNA binding protein YcfA (HicA-like mRNA interferase family)